MQEPREEMDTNVSTVELPLLLGNMVSQAPGARAPSDQSMERDWLHRKAESEPALELFFTGIGTSVFSINAAG